MTDKMRSFLKGLAMGLAGKPLEFAPGASEIVAYLYNGVRLPKLPEWDREAYPYAFLCQHELDKETGNVVLFVLPNIEFLSIYGWAVSTENNLSSVSQNGGEWSALKPFEDAVSRLVVQILWANFDVLNEDGTVYLSASEPVAVYE